MLMDALAGYSMASSNYSSTSALGLEVFVSLAGRSRFAMGDQRGAHAADEGGGAEFGGDAVRIVAEPESGVLFELLVGLQFEGIAINFAQAQGEADRVASVMYLAPLDLDPQQIGRVEGMDHEGDVIASGKLLAAD